MASQQQAQSQMQDDLLDHLDEDHKEMHQRTKPRRKKKRQAPKKETAPTERWLRNVVLAALGICVGLAAHSLLVNAGMKDKAQPKISEERTAEILKDLRQQTFSIAGHDYDTSSTLATFESNGWKVDTTDATPTPVLTPGQNVSMSLQQGTQVIDTFSVKNNTKQDCALEAGALDHIYVYDEEVDISGPYGLSPNMTPEEAVQVLKDNDLPYEVKKHSGDTYYGCSFSGRLSDQEYASAYISFNVHNNRIESMTFSEYSDDIELYISMH
jgi:hypothetical protein